MIKSMTAYSEVVKTSNKLSVRIEMRSFNSRHLDLQVRLGQAYLEFETGVRELISQKVTRGRLEIKIRITAEAVEFPGFEIDTHKARSYNAALQKLGETLEIQPDPAAILMQIANFKGVIHTAEPKINLKMIWPLVREGIEAALENWDIMRSNEGTTLEKDISQRLQALNDWMTMVTTLSQELPAIYQARLKERITSLTDPLIVEIDPARLAHEVAFIVDRSDITEELVRIKSHIQQFHQIMAAPEPAGRKLNFLLQELNRELNTLGSKIQHAKISLIVVTMKSELEKIREQVQNIE